TGPLVGGSAHLRGCVLGPPLRGRGAKALVIDVIGDRRALAAHRAFRIAAETHLAEAALQSVIQEITPDKRLADPEEQLDRLGRLDGSDDARQHAENARLRARRRELRRWRLGEQAAVARALERLEDGDLALESEDRAVYDRYAMFHRRVVQEIARGEVVGPIDHEVVALDDPVDVRGREALLVADDLHVRVQRLERALRGRDLRLADAIGRVQDLSLQIGEIDDIGVDDAEGADS